MANIETDGHLHEKQVVYLFVHVRVGRDLICDLSPINLHPDLIHGLHGLLTLNSPGIGEFCGPGNISWDKGLPELVYSGVRERFDGFLLAGGRICLIASFFDLNNALVRIMLRVRDV
jgi:hypothetical protein